MWARDEARLRPCGGDASTIMYLPMSNKREISPIPSGRVKEFLRIRQAVNRVPLTDLMQTGQTAAENAVCELRCSQPTHFSKSVHQQQLRNFIQSSTKCDLFQAPTRTCHSTHLLSIKSYRSTLPAQILHTEPLRPTKHQAGFLRSSCQVWTGRQPGTPLSLSSLAASSVIATEWKSLHTRLMADTTSQVAGQIHPLHPQSTSLRGQSP